MSDKNILILYGTETGNAKALGEDAEIMASKMGFEAKLEDMEYFEAGDISDYERLLIICSTWGDGEQPYSAQDLYDSVSSLSGEALKGVNFSVLALGDTSYELFCESGKEWDKVIEEKGGTRVKDRVDLDTDYDDYADDWIMDTLDLMFQIPTGE